MAFLLLLLTMVATAASVFSDNYTFIINCDGTLSGDDMTYCYVPDIEKHSLGYYKLELIKDTTSPYLIGCKYKAYYTLLLHNDRPAVRVASMCNGTFGIKPKVAGFPKTGICGQDNYGSYKIIDGSRAKNCEFPWMAYVNLNMSEHGYNLHCGGSIVADKWILTAGHCIVQHNGNGKIPPLSTVYVRTGTLYREYNYIQRSVDKIVIHPRYDHIDLGHDIALLRLKTPIKWDGCHAPVCLNTNRNLTKSSQLKCIISGWGLDQIHSYVIGGSRELLWAYDTILSRKKCDQIYGRHSQNSTICGKGPSNGRPGFCAGDSGGPLVCKSDQNGRFYQHGIASLSLAGRDCFMEALYTNVADLYDWIESVINP